MPEPRLNLGAAAAYLGVSRWTLRRWLTEGLIQPSLTLPSGTRWWLVSDLDKILTPDRKSA